MHPRVDYPELRLSRVLEKARTVIAAASRLVAKSALALATTKIHPYLGVTLTSGLNPLLRLIALLPRPASYRSTAAPCLIQIYWGTNNRRSPGENMTNKSVLQKTNTVDIGTRIETNRLRCHVLGMPEAGLPKFLLEWTPNYGKRSRGRPRKTWLACVLEDAMMIVQQPSLTLED
ncbi:hypothetical protein Bbelb_357600 [Branchiostoma belcheri]|nr:hypothetical protein Bbelb_357600 [Branchiostoma belcheri]